MAAIGVCCDPGGLSVVVPWVNKPELIKADSMPGTTKWNNFLIRVHPLAIMHSKAEAI